MNRTTLYAMIAFVVLLGAVLVMRYAPAGAEQHILKVAGWPADEAPFDTITIVRGGETIVIEKQGNADDAEWLITAPIHAGADKFKVKQVYARLTEPLESSLSKKVGPADLRAFKLDDKNRIGLKLAAKGETLLDVVVGGIEKGETPPAGGTPDSDTWLMKPGEEDRAYRMPGVDLRSAIDKEVTELRSKKVFTQKADTITRVHITSAADLMHPTFSLVREEGGEGVWRFENPKGYEAGDVKAWLNTVLSAYANEYLPVDDPEGMVALTDAPVGISLTAEDGQTIALTVGKPGEKHGYLKVEGRDEIVKLSHYTAQRMRASIADLRQRKLFPMEEASIAKISLSNENGSYVLVRDGERWKAEEPADLQLDEKPMTAFLRHVAGMKVSDYVGQLPPSETGLDEPVRKLVVEAAGKVHTLLVGAEKDGKRYGTLVGSGEVFTLTNWTADKLAKKPEDFKAKPKPTTPPMPQ